MRRTIEKEHFTHTHTLTEPQKKKKERLQGTSVYMDLGWSP